MENWKKIAPENHPFRTGFTVWERVAGGLYIVEPGFGFGGPVVVTAPDCRVVGRYTMHPGFFESVDRKADELIASMPDAERVWPWLFRSIPHALKHMPGAVMPLDVLAVAVLWGDRQVSGTRARQPRDYELCKQPAFMRRGAKCPPPQRLPFKLNPLGGTHVQVDGTNDEAPPAHKSLEGIFLRWAPGFLLDDLPGVFAGGIPDAVRWAASTYGEKAKERIECGSYTYTSRTKTHTWVLSGAKSMKDLPVALIVQEDAPKVGGDRTEVRLKAGPRDLMVSRSNLHRAMDGLFSRFFPHTRVIP